MSHDLHGGQKLEPRLAEKLAAMREGGARLRIVKHGLASIVRPGVTFEAIEAKAQELIAAQSATPNFSLVPNYNWATCIMRNDEMCHGIPVGKRVEESDLIKVDVGLLWQKYNLDTTITVKVGKMKPEVDEFVDTSRKALEKAISKAVVGNSIFDISYAMQSVMESAGYGMVYQLTGHGIGLKLHEEPYVPCIAQESDKHKKLYAGQTLAIEVMAAMGDASLILDKDGWTYRTRDGSWAVMMEETVEVGEKVRILT